jgi:hypothetical protein
MAEATPATPGPLPDRQPRPRSGPLDEALEDMLGLTEAIPSEQQFLNALPIPAPLLHFVEVAPVRIERVVGFFVGPVVGHPGLALLLRHPAQQ